MGRRDRGPPKGGLVRKGIRALAGGVGLASEGVKAHKESKTVKTDVQGNASTSRTNSDGHDSPDPDVKASEDPSLAEAISRRGY